MAWSTREIAELAGTSLRAVRHYHEVGLLDEPQRRSNGYKQYGVAHLVRLLRIKRLVDLGFSLPQIAEMGDADAHPEEALRTLDAELAATIERLQRARVELGLILRQSVSTDIPVEFTPGTNVELSDADRSFMVVLSRTLGPQGREAYGEAIRTLSVDPVLVEFEELPADADEETRQDLAERVARYVRSLHADYPGLRDLNGDAPRGRGFAANTASQAVQELYNRAQVDIFQRLPSLLDDAPESQ